MKKLLIYLFLSIFLMVIAGPVNAEEYNLSVALSLPLDSEQGRGVQEFKRLLEKRTDGKIKLTLFPNEQLGKEVDVVTSMQMGTVDMGVYGTTIYEQAAPEYNIWSAYYIFNNVDELMYVLNGKIGEEMNEAVIKNKGIRILGYGLRGPRNLTTNFPVEKPQDVEGLNIRVPLQAIYISSWKELGARPQSISYGELYTSLKQGLVDAQENPLANIYASKIYEVNRYINLTQHQRAFYTYTISEKAFKKLPDNLRRIVIQTGKDVTKFHTNLQMKNEKKLRKKLENEGVTFIKVDRKAFKEALRNVPNKFSSRWAPNLYKRIQEQIKEFNDK